jgi:hypothetical protein
MRWMTGNEGFNPQKTTGWGQGTLGHDWNARQCWYLLAQIAHPLRQLVLLVPVCA